MKGIWQIENNSTPTIKMKVKHDSVSTAKGKQILWKTTMKATVNGLKRLGHNKYSNILQL